MQRYSFAIRIEIDLKFIIKDGKIEKNTIKLTVQG